jgi:hypothetical protein
LRDLVMPIHNDTSNMGGDAFPGKMATINYQVSDCGTHYTVTPMCYFDTRGSKAKVTLDRETGRLSITPKRPPRDKDVAPETTSMVYGGHLFLPKKADLSKDPTLRHEGNKGNMLLIDIAKLPEHHQHPPPLQIAGKNC